MSLVSVLSLHCILKVEKGVKGTYNSLKKKKISNY